MSVLVVALHKSGQLNSSTFEAVTAAASFGQPVTIAVLADSCAPFVSLLKDRVNGTIVNIEHPSLAACNDEIYVKVLTELVASKKPQGIIMPATLYGKSVMSRLAAVLNAPMISDVTAINIDAGKLAATRPGFGGSVISDVRAELGDRPVCLSIRPKTFPAATGGSATMETFTPSAAAFESRAKIKEVRVESSGTVTLADADRVVSAGRGIKGPEHVPMVQALAKSVGAAFGASRAVVDAGWVPYAHQVGQTGRTVNPKLYIAVGVSGAIQHLVGMQSSQTIVAINKDKDAPIFKIASYGIVGDLFDILPAMTKKFESELSR